MEEHLSTLLIGNVDINHLTANPQLAEKQFREQLGSICRFTGRQLNWKENTAPTYTNWLRKSCDAFSFTENNRKLLKGRGEIR